MLGDLDLVILTIEINCHIAHKLLWSFGGGYSLVQAISLLVDRVVLCTQMTTSPVALMMQNKLILSP